MGSPSHVIMDGQSWSQSRSREEGASVWDPEV